MKFGLGQKVKITHDADWNCQIRTGAVGEVVGFNGPWPKVKLDGIAEPVAIPPYCLVSVEPDPTHCGARMARGVAGL